MEKILFDTDIGSDIDDAICLAYLLKQPECELLGITTVSGEVEKRSMLASAICKAAGKDIPIHTGTEQPLLTAQRQPIAGQAAKLPNWPHDKDFAQNDAVEFMRRVIRENPGEVTLLAVGPMTNVGLLFATDPEIPAMLKQLVLMCGVFTNAFSCNSEWNALCDPYATAIVYNAPVKRHISVGLDVTFQVQMKKGDARGKFTSDVTKPVMDFADAWFADESGKITFHDPLAGTVIFDDEICKLTRGNVTVELLSDRVKGMTHFDKDENGRHEVALAVDAERFFKHYFDIVNK